MNAKFKLATAAVAMAISGGAFAQATPGDILVDVYDPTSHAEIAFDTGLAISSSTTQNTSVTLSSLSNWATFASAVSAGGGSLSSLDFIVFGTTASGIGKNITHQLEIGMQTTGTLAVASMAGPIGALTSNITTGNNAYAPGFWNSGQGVGTGTFGGYLSASAIGTETSGLNVYYGSAASAVAAPTLLTTASLSSTTFTLGSSSTPTPEPGSYALMVAGLLAVGAIARRRARA